MITVCVPFPPIGKDVYGKNIKEELLNLEIGKHSSDEYFSDIDERTRFEFLTSIALKQSLPNATIIPNYSIDDEGNPTFTARGGIGDIEVNDEKNNNLYQQYKALAEKEQNVIFGGRLAEYKYYDMAPIVELVLNLFK